MKTDFHFHFYSRIVIMAVLAVSLFFIQQSVRSTAQITLYPYEISGWAWNSEAGWLSLNCWNDFEKPGEYSSTCLNAPAPDDFVDILRVSNTGELTGCAWAGNDLGGTGSPLGWVCFGDIKGLDLPSYGVSTSTLYLNALEPTSFASILNQENWRCTDTGLNCAQDSDCASNSCYFTDDEAWKLGFPIANPVYTTDEPSNTNPIEGCFNCREEYEYGCSNAAIPCTSDLECGIGTCSIPIGVTKSCDNCLEYKYHLGRCEDGSGAATGLDCIEDTDCTGTDTCENISTCWIDKVTEWDCTALTGGPGTCPVGTDICTEREIGSYSRTLGGYNCSVCDIESYDNTCGINAYGGNLNSCESCVDTFYTPGVMIDHKNYGIDSLEDEKAYLCGWGWSGDDTVDPIDGLGWFQFAPRIATTTKPYIFVESGNIYSQKGVAGNYAPPFGRHNASYLIESHGGINNFVSSSTLEGVYQGELPYQSFIKFPELISGKYVNVLGSIDYEGLKTDVDPGLDDINKYGATIDPILIPTDIFDEPLGGDVKYYSGNLILNNVLVPPETPDTFTILAGTGARPDASGIIFIDGGLQITENIEYETGVSYSNLMNIPSVVWIVMGDLHIGPDVTELVGTFIVLGTGIDCNPLAISCGQIITCDVDINTPLSPTSCSELPLTINGSVMAKYFDLGRTFTDTADYTPSEQFISDGRLQANPPVSFEDFSNLIPRFTEN